MALPLWGQLEKSVDDPQTIQEAIDAAIAAHNEEPDAHLGSDQSLESHKTENVIDHPPGSVLADKTTDREYVFSPTFESISNWDTSGFIEAGDPGTLSLYIEDGAVEVSAIDTTLNAIFRYIDFNFDFLFEIFCRTDTSNTDYNIRFGIYDGNFSNPYGVGMELDAGTLRGVFRTSSTELTTGAITHDFTVGHFYRIRYDATDEVAYFMIDGNQVASLDLSGQSFTHDDGLLVRFENTAVNDGFLHCGSVRTSRALS